MMTQDSIESTIIIIKVLASLCRSATINYVTQGNILDRRYQRHATTMLGIPLSLPPSLTCDEGSLNRVKLFHHCIHRLCKLAQVRCTALGRFKGHSSTSCLQHECAVAVAVHCWWASASFAAADATVSTALENWLGCEC